MDLLSRLPVAKALPAADFKPATARESRDSRVEETGALSFSGLLARNQESTEVNSSGRQKPAEDGKNQQGAQNASAAAPDKSTLVAQTVKIKLAQAAAAPLAPAGQETPKQDLGAATAEVQPTGGDGQGAILLDLAAVKTGAEAVTMKPAATLSTLAENVPADNSPAKTPGITGPVLVKTPVMTPPTGPAAESGSQPKLELTAHREPPVTVPAQAQTPTGDIAASPVERMVAENSSPGMEQAQVRVEVPSGKMDPAQEKPVASQADQAALVETEEAEVTGIKEAGGQAAGQQDQASGGDDHQASAQAALHAEGPAGDGKTAHGEASGEQAAAVAETESATPEAVHNATRPRVSATSAATAGRVDLLEQGRNIRRQVIQELSSSLDGRIGNEKITLQLNPEKLGQVEIQFLARGNDLSIAISASSNDAEQAIREGIKELAEGIADKSARWQQVDIKVDQRGQEQDKNDSRQESRRDQSRRDGRQNPQQQHRQHTQSGGPDWASLRQEG